MRNHILYHILKDKSFLTPTQQKLIIELRGASKHSLILSQAFEDIRA